MNIPDNLNLLLIEDMVSDTFLLQRQLKKITENPEIRFVDSEIGLINAIKTFIPDMVITDFNLNGMNAFDVIRIVKSYNKKIPIIVISGNLKYQADAEELLHKGAEGFFLKEPMNSLNERLLPLFKQIFETKEKDLDTLKHERHKFSYQKSNSDFLREHTFNTETTSDEFQKPVSFWHSIRNIFRNPNP